MTSAETPARVCFPSVGDTIGGSHISALLLIRNLDPQRYLPIIVIHEEGPLSEHLNGLGLSYLHCPIPGYLESPYRSLRNLTLLLRTAPKLISLLKHNRISIVHTNDFRMHGSWTIATRLAGCKVIWHQRSAGFGESRIKKFLARLTHRVVCISDFTAEQMPPAITQRLAVVGNPLDTGQAPPNRQASKSALVEHLRCEPESRVVGFFGNLTARKRPFVFARAAAIIAKSLDVPVVFAVVGEKRQDYAEKIAQCAKDLGIESHVHLMGFRMPVERWMAGCDVILAPAVNEGFGRTLVEAMSVGTPVVAANSGGHAEIIQDGKTGLLVPADDPEALAEATLGLLRKSETAQDLARRALAYVRQSYSIDKHVEEITRCYDQLLEETKPQALETGCASLPKRSP